ncbi:MAG: DUF4129 domain-containing protein [Candidatus Hodarchaeales archaeon]|jgi:hypothetical protein
MQGLGQILFFGIIAAVGGFLIYYFRDYIPILARRPEKTDTDAEIEMLLDKIRQLARSHEYTKASSLVWRAFSVASEGYLGLGRVPSQTARQYGLSMMQFEGVNQETVEPLYEVFEKARYGRDPVTLQEFNSGLTGLHRFLQIANQLSSQMAVGAPEEEEAYVDEGFEDEDDDFDFDD